MLLRKIILVVLFISIGFNSVESFGQEVEKVQIGTKFKMHSNFLNEERMYTVGLPKSYHTSLKDYPILVILDGDEHFLGVSGIVDQMNQGRSQGHIPELIIIALSNTDRTRDFTPTNSITFLDGSQKPQYQQTSGGSAAFLKFLEKELLVAVEKKYRTNSYKTLIGHSYGGLLTGLSYLSKESTFDSYLAIDPSFWWDNQIIIKKMDAVKTEVLKAKKMYISSAYSHKTWDKFVLNRKPQDLFFAKLQDRSLTSPNLKIQYFEEEDHWTVPAISLYHGLKFIYQDSSSLNAYK
jgi:predicted alpha/beta superfamily hydrolase